MELFSPKSLFYLDNRRRIAEWAQMELTALGEAHQWMCSWSELMEERIDEPDVEVYARLEDTSDPYILWYRSSWRSGADADEPRVGIGVSWVRRDAFAKRGVYAGVRVDFHAPEFERRTELYQEIHSRLATFRSELAAGSTKWWPLRVFPDPLPDYLADQQLRDKREPLTKVGDATVYLEEYRDQVLNALSDHWHRFAPIIDAAVDKVPSATWSDPRVQQQAPGGLDVLDVPHPTAGRPRTLGHQ